jgi:hypothetical protein
MGRNCSLYAWGEGKTSGGFASQLVLCFSTISCSPFYSLAGENQKYGLALGMISKKTRSMSAHMYDALRQCSRGLSCLQHRSYLAELLITVDRATN